MLYRFACLELIPCNIETVCLHIRMNILIAGVYACLEVCCYETLVESIAIFFKNDPVQMTFHCVILRQQSKR